MEMLTLGDLRRKAGLSQDQLSKQADIALVNIQKWESGGRVPTITAVQKLAKILGDAVFHAEYGVPSKRERGGKGGKPKAKMEE
jgi:transcriptional regulator with XRE-family HTH domain